VGLGYATTNLHLPALRKLPASIEVALVGGADTDATRRAQWAGLGAGPAYPSLDALLEDARPDVIVVATPPDSHARFCVKALEAGAKVVCEKPFVETLSQADEVLAAAARTGHAVAVNHEFRYMPIFSVLPQTVDKPGVGRPVFLSCVQFMDLAPWEEPVAWRAAMPHRSLFEGGVHLVDLMHMVVGRLPRTVSAHVSAGLDPARHADAIHLLTLDYEDGLLGQIIIDRLCKAGTRYLDLRVDCEEASVRASYGGRAFIQVGVKRAERPGVRFDFGPEGLAWKEQGLRRRVLARNPRRAAAQATAALYSDVLRAWQRGMEPPTAASVARQTLQIIEAAYRSAEEGHPIELAKPASPQGT
jgi:predicted dehydrogenase